MYQIAFIGNLTAEEKAKGKTQIHTDSALNLLLNIGDSVKLETLPDWASDATWTKLGKANPFLTMEVTE